MRKPGWLSEQVKNSQNPTERSSGTDVRSLHFVGNPNRVYGRISQSSNKESVNSRKSLLREAKVQNKE